MNNTSRKYVWVLVGLAGTCYSLNVRSEPAFKGNCQNIGMTAMEPVGDRAGHNLSVSQYTCRIEGGPLDGSVMTGSSSWEWDGPNGIGRAGAGVYRKAGTVVVYDHSDAQITLNMVDGKPAGFVSTGHGHYTMGTGSAAALQGRAYSFVARSSGFNQFVLEVNQE